MSADDQLKQDIADALSGDAPSGAVLRRARTGARQAGYRVPARVVGAAASLDGLDGPNAAAGRQVDEGSAEWACLVVDTRTERAHEARWAWGRSAAAPWQVLYVNPRATDPDGGAWVAPVAMSADTGSGRRTYAADLDLRWDEALQAVPLRTVPDESTFGARLRARLVLLPADARCERLYAEVTGSPDGRHPPAHAEGRYGCAQCGRAPLRRSVRRGTDQGNALLRLLLRPEWYPNGVAHAVRPFPTRDVPAPDAEALATERQKLNRHLRAARLARPVEAAHVALLLRASALAAAHGLGVIAVERLLGFSESGRDDRPAHSTFNRLLWRLTGTEPGAWADFQWLDINEAARLALVRRRGVGAPPEHVLRPWSPDDGDDFDPAGGWPREAEIYRPIRGRDFPAPPDLAGPGPVLERPAPAHAELAEDVGTTDRTDDRTDTVASSTQLFLQALAGELGKSRSGAPGEPGLGANLGDDAAAGGDAPAPEPIGVRNGRCVWCGATVPVQAPRPPRSRRR